MNILAVTNRHNNQGTMTNGVRAAMALQRIGHNVKIEDHRELSVESIRKADIILAFGTLIYLQNAAQAKMIAEQKNENARFALWYFDACNPVFRHSAHKVGTLQKIAPYLDWLFMTDHSYSWEYQVKNFGWLMQGVDASEFNHAVASYDDKRRRVDVVFSGTHMRIFEERERELKVIKNKYNLLWIGAQPRTRITGSKFHVAYQQAKVAIVPAPPSCVRNQYWSNRVYLATATGTPCVVGYSPGIEKHFVDNQEVLYYHNQKEMLDRIDRLIKDEKLRARIGKAGRRRTLKDHTYDRRVKWLVDTMVNRWN